MQKSKKTMIFLTFAFSGPSVHMEQSATSHGRLQFLTEHLQAEAENSSVRTMTNITRRPALWRFVISGAVIQDFSFLA